MTEPDSTIEYSIVFLSKQKTQKNLEFSEESLGLDYDDLS